jgi:hypothetical protein
MQVRFVRKHLTAILVSLAALFLMALPMQEARADSLNLGTVANFDSGSGLNLLNLLIVSGGLTDTQIFLNLTNQPSGTTGSPYYATWDAILSGSDGSISLSEANLFAELFGGTGQQWENFFASWWGNRHTAVPEPGTLGLLACGLLGLLSAGSYLKRRVPISR